MTKGGSWATKVREASIGGAADVSALMEIYGQTVALSRESGHASSFTVEIDQTGRQTITAPHRSDRPSAALDTNLDRALDAARERGRLKVAEILGGEEMLSADEFGMRIGVSRMTVNAWRKRQTLLALDGAKRGFRFPAWQIGLEGRPFDVLPRLFAIFKGSPWSVYRFLVQRHPELNGATARDALTRGRSQEVLEIAKGLADGTFS